MNPWGIRQVVTGKPGRIRLSISRCFCCRFGVASLCPVAGVVLAAALCGGSCRLAAQGLSPQPRGGDDDGDGAGRDCVMGGCGSGQCLVTWRALSVRFCSFFSQMVVGTSRAMSPEMARGMEAGAWCGCRVGIARRAIMCETLC